jgi:hypothetical protein
MVFVQGESQQLAERCQCDQRRGEDGEPAPVPIAGRTDDVGDDSQQRRKYPEVQIRAAVDDEGLIEGLMSDVARIDIRPEVQQAVGDGVVGGVQNESVMRKGARPAGDEPKPEEGDDRRGGQR